MKSYFDFETFEQIKDSFNDPHLNVQQIETLLDESQERFATIFNTVPAGILIIDAETHIIQDANEKALEMIGAGADRVIDAKCHDFICSSEEGRCPITDLHQNIDNSERELITSSGKRIPVIKSAAHITLEGRPHIVETFLDISLAKNAEQERKQSEERYRDLFDHVSDFIQMVSSDGAFVYVNPAWETTLGYSGSEISGLTFEKLIPSANYPAFLATFNSILRGDSIEFLETTFTTNGGKMIEVEGTVSCQKNDGALSGIRFIWRDITERKRAAHELAEWNRLLEKTVAERTRQLEVTQARLMRAEKMASIDKLVFGAAHELNNPIGGILSAAQFLRKNKLEEPMSSAREEELLCLDEMEKAAQRCQQIVETLWTFSGQSRCERKPLQIGKVLEEAVHNLETESPDSGISTRLIMTDLPDICGDPALLTQAFTNLLLNAKNACNPGGTIEIHAALSKNSSNAPTMLCVWIKDNGRGIPRENLSRIFDPFFTTQPVGQGTGLGLTVSYAIIRRHKGEIDVQSEPGVGTEVLVTLPLNNAGTEDISA